MNKQMSIGKSTIKRPLVSRSYLPNGEYFGEIVAAEIIEMDSQFHSDGKREVLNMKVEVNSPTGDIETFFVSPTLSWSSKGKMVQILQNLNCLPSPGEDLLLQDLIGISVSVIIENKTKDDVTYSNIIEMKSDGSATSKTKAIKSSSQTDFESLFED
ncbi:hypothetical protein [Neobacillus mesonae]|uniref:hypothetical protein n=1 Tax=Neobacillus mesonae TaxID=1193713 RepID=UPI0025723535|nr:hypothetical protein [Neobacillus mesonae]